LRRDPAGAPFITDGGNSIYDCVGFGPVRDAVVLQARLADLVGVLETGLFVGLASEAFVGDVSGAVHRLGTAFVKAAGPGK